MDKMRIKDIWRVLVEAAAEKRTIEYTDLAVDSGMISAEKRQKGGPLPIRYLHEIQHFCADNGLPPLTVLAHSTKGVRGAGYDFSPDLSVDEEVALVWRTNWNTIGNPYDDGENSFQSSVKILKNGCPEDKENAARRPYREQQPAFRKALLDYYNKCAFCDISITSILDAAHIKPWSSCDSLLEKVDLNNGLILCKNHHYAFDAGLIWVSENLQITTLNSEVSGQVKHRKCLELPEEINSEVIKGYLDYHREHKPKR